MNSGNTCPPKKPDHAGLTRRAWLHWALKVAVGLGLWRFTPNAEAFAPSISPPKGHPTIGETFANEVMKFTAGFLFFHHAGDAEISLVPMAQPGRYQATLSGKTRGIIGFFTRHREDTHISELIEDRKQTRFICTRLIRDTKIGDHHTTKVFEMDYKSRRLTVTRFKGNRKSVHVKSIPQGVFYDDPLTAFYNFRFGSYGRVEYGKTFIIHTIPGKRLNTITLKLASREETAERSRHLSILKRAKYLVFLKLDPDMIKSKRGDIEGWLNADLIPLYGVAKDVIFFGDVKGKLVTRQKFFIPPPPL